jgi:hypothetical protein
VDANAASDTWVSWEVTSDETVSTDQDLLLYHPFNVDISGKNGGDKNSDMYFIRCDSANYFANRSRACIFNDVIPHLQYRILNPDGSSSSHREVAEHIQQAFTDPDSTFPLQLGRHKEIPGDFRGGDGLTRYLERIPTDSAEYSRNGLEKDRACQRRSPYTDTGLPSPPGAGQQCDEYPFASTAQGAGARSRGLPWDFSVKAVTTSHNASAGNALGQFYRDDRILYSLNKPIGEFVDLFYVEILPGGEGGLGGGFGSPVRDFPPVVDAGPDRFGNEGGPVTVHGSAEDFYSTPNVTWSYTPGPDVDPGATCVFSDPHAVSTSITCTDDGTFEIRLTASDGLNDPTSDTALVILSNMEPALSVTGPAPWQLFRAGTPVALTVPVTDPGSNDAHTCAVNWDDAEPVQTYPAGPGCDQTHTYAHAGMYTIRVTATDDDGGTATTSVLVVVYDPDAGWVNMDASTLTPAGALVGSPDASQWTWAHLAAHYYTPTGPPTGTAKTWVPQTPYRMESTALQWLVVTPDGKIAVRGTGTGADGASLASCSTATGVARPPDRTARPGWTGCDWSCGGWPTRPTRAAARCTTASRRRGMTSTW